MHKILNIRPKLGLGIHIIEVTWPNSGNKWQNILIVLPPDLPGVPVRLLFGSREVAGGADNDKISLAKHYVRKSGKKGHF